jgi:biopolymer transport protein ExbD
MTQPVKYQSTPLLAPIVDVFILSLMLMLLNRPVFGVEERLLPILQVPEPSASQGRSAEREARPEACLRLDGSVLWNKEAVPIDKLAERIAQQTGEQQKVVLIVEIDAQGQGAAKNLLQLQLDAGRLNLGSRLQVMSRPAGADNPLVTNQKRGTP